MKATTAPASPASYEGVNRPEESAMNNHPPYVHSGESLLLTVLILGNLLALAAGAYLSLSPDEGAALTQAIDAWLDCTLLNICPTPVKE